MGKTFTQSALSPDTYCESKENRSAPPNSDQVLNSDRTLGNFQAFWSLDISCLIGSTFLHTSTFLIIRVILNQHRNNCLYLCLQTLRD